MFVNPPRFVVVLFCLQLCFGIQLLKYCSGFGETQRRLNKDRLNIEVKV